MEDARNQVPLIKWSSTSVSRFWQFAGPEHSGLGEHSATIFLAVDVPANPLQGQISECSEKLEKKTPKIYSSDFTGLS